MTPPKGPRGQGQKKFDVAHPICVSQGWTQRGCLQGCTSSQGLEPSGSSREQGESMRGAMMEAHWRGVRGGGLPQKFFKIYVSENAFQAILKPSFPYSITSILSKVRHSNPRGGGTLIFSYTRRLRLIFFGGRGVKILNFDIFGGFQKNDILLGMKIMWIFFGGHHKIGLYLGVISMHFRVFLKVNLQNGGYFLCC